MSQNKQHTDFSEEVENLARTETMKVPDNYFTTVHESIMNQVEEQKTSKRRVIINYVTYAAAVVVLLTGVFFGWKYFSHTEPSATNTEIQFAENEDVDFEDLEAEMFYQSMATIEWDDLESIYEQ